MTGVQEVFMTSFEEMRDESRTIVDESEEDMPINTVIIYGFISSYKIIKKVKPECFRNPSVSETQVIRNEPAVPRMLIGSVSIPLQQKQ